MYTNYQLQILDDSTQPISSKLLALAVLVKRIEEDSCQPQRINRDAPVDGVFFHFDYGGQWLIQFSYTQPSQAIIP